MNKGRIEQVGTPEDVYEQPANPFVYRFLGNVNLFSGRIAKQANENDMLFIRPHEIEVSLSGSENCARILSHRILGAHVRLILELAENGQHSEPIEAEISKAQWSEIKQQQPEFVYLKFLNMRGYSSEQWSEYVI